MNKYMYIGYTNFTGVMYVQEYKYTIKLTFIWLASSRTWRKHTRDDNNNNYQYETEAGWQDDDKQKVGVHFVVFLWDDLCCRSCDFAHWKQNTKTMLYSCSPLRVAYMKSAQCEIHV